MVVEIEILKYGCATGVATSPASHQMDFIANKIFGGGISWPVLEFKVQNMQGGCEQMPSILADQYSQECVTFSGKRKKGGNDNKK
jgi:hypothetical protein